MVIWGDDANQSIWGFIDVDNGAYISIATMVLVAEAVNVEIG